MPPRLPRPRQILPTLLAGLGLLAALLLTSGCGIDEDELVGVWRGHSVDTSYTFELRSDGKGRVKVATGRNKVDYACEWSIDGERLWLRRAQGPTASFRIIEQLDDELVVRVANGLGGLCRMRRIAAEN